MLFTDLDTKQYKKHASLLADVAASVKYLLTVDRHIAARAIAVAYARAAGEIDHWELAAARNAATAAARRAHARGDEVSERALLSASYAADHEYIRAAPACAGNATRARDLAAGPGGSDQKERNAVMLRAWAEQQ
jgi:hypothetical protein